MIQAWSVERHVYAIGASLATNIFVNYVNDPLMSKFVMYRLGRGRLEQDKCSVEKNAVVPWSSITLRGIEPSRTVFSSQVRVWKFVFLFLVNVLVMKFVTRGLGTWTRTPSGWHGCFPQGHGDRHVEACWPSWPPVKGRGDWSWRTTHVVSS